MRDNIFMLLFFILLFVSGVEAENSPFSTGRMNGIGGTIILSTPIASEQLACGISSENNNILQAGFGYQRKYDLSELDIINFALSYTLKKYTIVAGMSQLGNPDLYTQKKIRVGLLYTKSLYTIGTFITSESHDFNNRYESLQQFSYSLAFSVIQKYFILSSVVDNLNSTQLTESSSHEEPKLSMYGELLRVKNYKTTLMFSTQKGNQNRFGIGETIEVSEAASLMFGFSTAPTQFSGGIEMRWKKQSVIYTSSYHPVLGLTHSVSFVIDIIDN